MAGEVEDPDPGLIRYCPKCPGVRLQPTWSRSRTPPYYLNCPQCLQAYDHYTRQDEA